MKQKPIDYVLIMSIHLSDLKYNAIEIRRNRTREQRLKGGEEEGKEGGEEDC